ncbi:MAG: hypothetical protein IJT64_00150 [Kiritimatiellae bacterium]|nr:hypothetical protein [Kiritimatiellia bacterium]
MNDKLEQALEGQGGESDGGTPDCARLAFVSLRERPETMHAAVTWFHDKWHVPTEAYLECMTAYLDRKTEYGWKFLCMAQGVGEEKPSRMYMHT